MKSTTILVLDDSILAREAFQQELELDSNIKVVAKASSAYDARDKIIEYEPDIMIADVNLGGMSGTDFLRKLLPQHYLPVILVSSDHSLGEVSKLVRAVDFIPKPIHGGPEEMSLFCRRLIARIKTIVAKDSFKGNVDRLSESLVAIGASTGGAQAIEYIIKELPSVMPPIVVAQHMPPVFTHTFAYRLNTLSRLSVKEAVDGDILIPGQVYVAPGGMHTVVKKRNFRYTLSCVPNTSNSSLCPSVDMLFDSVADLDHTRSVGVILTGMGKDGSVGLKRMHNGGSKIIGQDELSSVVYGMPKAAYDEGSVDYQLPLEKISSKILELVDL